MAETLAELVTADKMIAAPAEWSRVNRCLELKLPLEIAGLVEEQFFFRATALAQLPDEQVTFQLEYHGTNIPGGNGPLCRFEWNPKKPHDNKGRGPVELRFFTQTGSHFHSFEDNWCEANGALLRDNLPISRPISHDIQGFTECLEFVGNLFRIKSIGVVKTPEWVLDLGVWN
ncbi:hypothetical protein SPAN111604_06800 [Sphingomonas antarctica]|uniref:hypothetical protein n=1 Tax=Sphingomonas antarctica TaxID=2040274 RepID=UPI0039E9B7B8